MLLAEEKQSLAQENAALRERAGRQEGEGASGLTAKKLLLLQSQLEQLQEENFRCGQLGLWPAGQGVSPPPVASSVPLFPPHPQAGEQQGGRAPALCRAGAGGLGAAAAEPGADQSGPGGAGAEG